MKAYSSTGLRHVEEPITSYISARNSQSNKVDSPPLTKSQLDREFNQIDLQNDGNSKESSADTLSFNGKEQK